MSIENSIRLFLTASRRSSSNRSHWTPCFMQHKSAFSLAHQEQYLTYLTNLCCRYLQWLFCLFNKYWLFSRESVMILNIVYTKQNIKLILTNEKQYMFQNLEYTTRDPNIEHNEHSLVDVKLRIYKWRRKIMSKLKRRQR